MLAANSWSRPGRTDRARFRILASEVEHSVLGFRKLECYCALLCTQSVQEEKILSFLVPAP